MTSLAKNPDLALKQTQFPTLIRPSAWWGWHSASGRQPISASWCDCVLGYLKELLSSANQLGQRGKEGVAQFRRIAPRPPKNIL